MTAAAALQPRPGLQPISVMVVDDSAVIRGLISRQIQSQPDMALSGSASNGEMALVELRRRPVDVIVLDIEMPIMDGLTALPLLLKALPGVRVLIASTLTRRNAEIGFKALQLGASDYLGKPESLVAAEEFNRDLVAKIRALGRRQDARPAPAAPAAAAPVIHAPPGLTRPQVIAIGGSTGAPPVLTRLFGALRGHVDAPILVTQHMPPTFTAILAEQLARHGGRPCAEAVDGEPVLAGRCYVAPGGWHMTVAREGVQPVIRLNQGPAENFCRPAVDPLFRGVAAVWGRAAFAVILTGMGADGAKGCAAIAAAGGRFVVQDEATSVVWGMPGAAAKAATPEKVLPRDAIAPYLIQVTGGRA
jgi:two-component system chemotaxis response regulator CheB